VSTPAGRLGPFGWRSIAELRSKLQISKDSISEIERLVQTTLPPARREEALGQLFLFAQDELGWRQLHDSPSESRSFWPRLSNLARALDDASAALLAFDNASWRRVRRIVDHHLVKTTGMSYTTFKKQEAATTLFVRLLTDLLNVRDEARWAEEIGKRLRRPGRPKSGRAGLVARALGLLPALGVPSRRVRPFLITLLGAAGFSVPVDMDEVVKQGKALRKAMDRRREEGQKPD
jgi:hypothetical protein